MSFAQQEDSYSAGMRKPHPNLIAAYAYPEAISIQLFS